MRAGLPPAVVLPKMISSTAPASSRASSSAACTTGVARLSMRRLLCSPPGRPSAVRRAAIIYAGPSAVAEVMGNASTLEPIDGNPAAPPAAIVRLSPVTPQEHGEILPVASLGGWRCHARVL